MSETDSSNWPQRSAEHPEVSQRKSGHRRQGSGKRRVRTEPRSCVRAELRRPPAADAAAGRGGQPSRFLRFGHFVIFHDIRITDRQNVDIRIADTKNIWQLVV
jgi:hypothetical protein